MRRITSWIPDLVSKGLLFMPDFIHTSAVFKGKTMDTRARACHPRVGRFFVCAVRLWARRSFLERLGACVCLA